MITPLLSVVIPTHQRPKFLARSIASVLSTTSLHDVEVVVVPNGSSDEWRTVAVQYERDSRVRWLPLPIGNACVARNHGLANAQGTYVRFLDDDDYLLKAAADQLELIEQTHADICSAPLANVTSDGSIQYSLGLPATNDFAAAAILPTGISLTQGSIFRRVCTTDVKWRENAVLYDDYFWMLDLAASREMAWLQTPEPVAAYVQHDGKRLSRVRRTATNSRLLVEALLNLHTHLSSTARLTPERTTATARALLTHAHSAFPASPVFLGSVIGQALALDPTASPTQPIFQKYPFLARNIVAAELAMLVPRYLTRGYRRALWSMGGMLSRLKP